MILITKDIEFKVYQVSVVRRVVEDTTFEAFVEQKARSYIAEVVQRGPHDPNLSAAVGNFLKNLTDKADLRRKPGTLYRVVEPLGAKEYEEVDGIVPYENADFQLDKNASNQEILAKVEKASGEGQGPPMGIYVKLGNQIGKNKNLVKVPELEWNWCLVKGTLNEGLKKITVKGPQ
jgi:hypothetical protein